ncbi:MAG: hypothetical protein WA755_16680 [Candidatus Acidiferrales bacterium]
MERNRNSSRRPQEGDVLVLACVPHQIDSSWDDEWGPRLAGFPLNIAYVRGLKRESPSRSQLEQVLYWFHSETYSEDAEHREMCYFTKHPNGYRVRVIFNKSRGIWRTDKFRGDVLICSAAGSTFDGAMLQTTMVSAEVDE